MEKRPHPVDCHVGAQVRLRRTLVGMSQEQLGARLGVTFQQVQKYEKGSNRISASRLWQIATILDVPVSFFFDGASAPQPDGMDGFEEAPQATISSMTQSSDSLALLRHFTQIGDTALRRSVVDLARSLSAASTGSDSASPSAADC